jgi:RNA polymerase sigma factor (sigma-70 family)
VSLPADSLLRRVAAGDDRAMEDCLDRYGGLVWSLARRFAPTRTDAEDAVQEIFIELWRVAERYDPAIASEPTFIATIARRRLIDRRRRDERRPVTAPWNDDAAPQATQTVQSVPDWVQLCEEADLARRSMRELSADQQRVLTLAIDGNCSQTEIAERLGLPLGTVKTHARRGLVRLRELLGVRPAGVAAPGGAR